MEICKKVISFQQEEGCVCFNLGPAKMRAYFLTESILRLRVSFGEEKKDASYCLMTTGWEDRLDGLFEGEREKLIPLTCEVSEDAEKITLSTPTLTLTVHKDPLDLVLRDAQGEEIYHALTGNPFIRDSNRRIVHYSRMEEDDCFYGFGEKGGALDKNKDFIRERPTDSWAYDPVKCDTLYKHIPFYIRLRRKNAKALGVFYNNFFESVFNLGRERSNYWERYSYWQADGGDIDVFLLAGPSMGKVLDDYTRLTGRPALLPKRALGYQGSSMYYSELEKDCDQVLVEFADTVLQKGFPIDGFHLSSGYTSQEAGRCVFTWNYTRFPDPKAYFAAMNERGAQNVPNVKPGILLGHPLFAEFQEKGVFIRDSENPNVPATGPWWGGPGAFWDFTKPEAREAWKQYLTDNVIAIGTDSIWDDNCEYDSLLDKDALCDYDGEGGTVGELKALMPTLMSRLACEAVKEYSSARPYVVCRSGSSGIQKYAQNWVGDNFTSWETLRGNIPTILGMSLSGQPNIGADIGGFAGPAPEEELFLRWVQHGIFQPRFSIHSASSDNTVTEPWMYAGSEDLIRDAMLLRYRFLPHLYSLEYEAHQCGAPILRPLVYEFQEDEKVYNLSDTFLLGRDLLIATVLEKGAKTRKVYLPKGTCWYELESHYACYEGGKEIEVPVSAASIPRFVRTGTILPMAGNQIYHMQSDPVTALDLLLVPPLAGEESSYLLYNDDGVTNAFEEGVFHKTHIQMKGGKVVEVSFSFEGSYESPVRDLTITLVNKEKCPFWIRRGDTLLPQFLDREKYAGAPEGWYYSQTDRAVKLKMAMPQEDFTLRVSFEAFDLYGMDTITL